MNASSKRAATEFSKRNLSFAFHLLSSDFMQMKLVF
tara:strand:- start:2625 stop:2732 length:108 start_codon:yes stop_codon:yes gene_type:complete